MATQSDLPFANWMFWWRRRARTCMSHVRDWGGQARKHTATRPAGKRPGLRERRGDPTDQFAIKELESLHPTQSLGRRGCVFEHHKRLALRGRASTRINNLQLDPFPAGHRCDGQSARAFPLSWGRGGRRSGGAGRCCSSFEHRRPRRKATWRSAGATCARTTRQEGRTRILIVFMHTMSKMAPN